MKQRKSPFKRQRKANPSGSQLMDLVAAGFRAADELGIDWVAMMREQLQEEGILPKPKEPKNDNH
jgi:hypothetical protein